MAAMTSPPTLSLAQEEALRAVEHWYADRRGPQEFYLAGYAGTGKTTLASYFLGSTNLYALTATYTGKAAHVLRRKGVDAGTIHSLIYTPIPDSNPVQFTLAIDSSPLANADLLVLDECSMIEDAIAADLRSFGKKILVLGDPAQLPPVRGEGAFTRRPPDFFLKEIHRQAAESPILALATAVREGKPLPKEYNREGAVITRYDRSLALRPGAQLLCGVHRHRWQLTRIARQAAGFAENPFPVVGEPLICCRNDKEEALYNGALGALTLAPSLARQPGLLRMRVKMEDKAFDQDVLVYRTPFDEHAQGSKLTPDRYQKGVQTFDWAYAITVHKAQGSEWPAVTVIDDSAFFREDRHRWLYTAITRAADDLVLLWR
jgi:exodeoxyribonuclease V